MKPLGYMCWKCGEEIPFDDEVWIDPKTTQATMSGQPYHVACAPPQLDIKNWLLLWYDNERACTRLIHGEEKEVQRVSEELMRVLGIYVDDWRLVEGVNFTGVDAMEEEIADLKENE
jgi:hypothetical protein